MEKVAFKQKDVREMLKATSHLIKLPAKQLWIDYDEEADVLYVSFRRPQDATNSVMTENGLVLRYKGRQLVGVTILEASKR